MTEDRQSWNVEKMNEGTKGLWMIGWWEVAARLANVHSYLV